IDIIPKDGILQLPQIIANHHLLFGDKKASSSSNIKPPKASELLEHYTPEQLRLHFINTSLGNKSVSFKPKVFVGQNNFNSKEFDPVLNEGNLLTNVFNRLVRSCFYTAQKHFDGKIPIGEISNDINEKSLELIFNYESSMYKYEFYKVFELLNIFLRDASKNWAVQSKLADTENSTEIRKQLLVDSFHIIRIATTLLHPLVPDGCEMIRGYLSVGKEIWDWNNIFKTIYELTGNNKNHNIKFLEPRVDFFSKHKNQFETIE
ncbi:MAG: methionine--tRNA ligase, partial [Saccharofermentanales bacterium]